ncbi:hypothetical protein VNO78_19357 [Psophocarpus tetragonolobus]|uniref:Uncharacterized protein n=1 Tax=Psophocarpus tetragonolobus TaxID=3891 RepID=A0AAN9SBW2_PSOTE
MRLSCGPWSTGLPNWNCDAESASACIYPTHVLHVMSSLYNPIQSPLLIPDIAMGISIHASPFDSIIFDLDDTLYPSATGIDRSVKKNIELFLIHKCGFSESAASTLRVELFKTYGGTLAGLRALGHDISADEYHGFVHGNLSYDSIKPDPQLRNLLCTIKQRKIVFTNADRTHAIRALDSLGIKDCFEQIICFETINPNLPLATRPDQFPVLLKPSLDAFKIALDAAKVDPRRTLFLDDSIRNIAAAKEVGLHTVLVGKTVKSTEADYAVECVHNVQQVIPEIWTKATDGADQTMTRTKSELEAVLACAVVGY